MRLEKPKQKIKPESPPEQDPIKQKVEELVKAIEDKNAKKEEAENKSKLLVEKILEQILMGELKPNPCMTIKIEIPGIFELFGAKSTKQSSFKYDYPPLDGTIQSQPEKTETPLPQIKFKPKIEQEENEVPII